jgi:uncharacterized lipoprotein YajG
MSVNHMLKNRTLVVSLLLAVVTAFLASGCETAPSGTKPASSRTAASAINKKIEDGAINVQGETDNAPHP